MKYLTSAINGYIYMSDAPCQRCPEGRAAQPRTASVASAHTAARRRRATRQGVFHLTAPGISLCDGGIDLKEAGTRNRSENRVHRQDLANPDSATAYLCRFDGCHLERPRQSGSDRFPASWGRSWLTALRRTGRFSWSIDWTVCFRKNWCRPMKLSCQTNLNGSQPQARQLSQNPRR
jgi:hypothetical protein